MAMGIFLLEKCAQKKMFILFTVLLLSCSGSGTTEIVLNPYEDVNWSEFGHYKAGLHEHTLQSDGHHMVGEVVRSYADAGFDILAITDHDMHPPNTQIQWGNVAPGDGTHLPADPKPESYPFNTTWPWTDFEALSPGEAGMIGIEAAELTFRHHMNSFFSSYNAHSGDVSEHEQIRSVGEDGGIVFFNHPGLTADWWTRRPVEWYVEHFESHSPDVLIGMEVTNASPDHETYDEGLWDQLLARFMPARPVWGFGTQDMHNMGNVHQSTTIFLLEELSESSVREAMEKGQFYFNKSTRRVDLRKGEEDLDQFPVIEEIEINRDAGTITVYASNYDVIKWISAPESLEPSDDYTTSNQPWPAGQVIHNDATLNYLETTGIRNYVRVELHRFDDDHIHRTFTNPIGIVVPE